MPQPTSFSTRETELAEVARLSREKPWSAWRPIPSWEVPDRAEFEVRPRDEGQIVEYSYATVGKRLYRCIYDRSDQSIAYYVRPAR